MITLQNMFDFMYSLIDFINGLWSFLNSNVQLGEALSKIVGVTEISVLGLLFGGGFAIVLFALIFKALVPIA